MANPKRSFPRSRRRGISFLEVVIATGLVGFVLLTATPQLSRSRASTKGAAATLVEAIAAARQRAISSGEPAALVLPSGGGRFPQSDGYYLLQGHQSRITDGRSFSREYPGVNIFVGEWALDSSSLTDPTARTSVGLPLMNQMEEGFDPTAWETPYPQDYHLIFSPSGRVYSKGIPHFDGAYHLVVTQGVTSGSSRLGRSLRTPTILGRPYTVSVSFMGQASVTTGLRAGDSTVSVRERAPDASVAPLPSRASSSTPTSVVEVKTVPELTDGGAVSGTEPVLLSAEVSGDGPLFALWEADGGTFSHTGRVSMEWNPATKTWISSWSWQAPDGVSEGEKFRLTLSITDRQGVVQTAPRSVDVEVGFLSSSSRLLYDEGWGYFFVTRIDGTDRLRFPTTERDAGGGYLYGAKWSPDGSRLVRFFVPSGAGGTPLLRFFDPSGNLLSEIPCSFLPVSRSRTRGLKFSWNPAGTRIALLASPRTYSPTEATGTIFIVNVDGSGFLEIAQPARSLEWSPDGSQIALSGGSPTEAFIVNSDGSGLTPIGSFSVGPFSPDGTRIAVVDAGRLGHIDTGGGDFREIPTASTGRSILSWSKDGSRVLALRQGPNTAATTVDNIVHWIQLDGTVVSSERNVNAYYSPVVSNDNAFVAFFVPPDGRCAVRGSDIGLGATWHSQPDRRLQPHYFSLP